MEIDEIISEIQKYNCKLIEITGGEPLVQKNSLLLMKMLCDLDYEVMLETSGSLLINEVDPRVKIIMDLKCPSSLMEKKNNYKNLNYLKPNDELKFVIGDRNDYEWSKEIIQKNNLEGKVEILFSPVFEKIQPIDIVQWILEDKLTFVRFQLQMHKYIWQPNARGV
jgi:7-carboxy-7-deazaguanine synthase